MFCLMAFDAVAIAFSYFFGLWLRFDFIFNQIPQAYLSAYAEFIPIYILFSLILFWALRLYRGIWSFVGFRELLRYMGVSFLASLVHSLAITFLFCRMPMSYYIVGMVLQLFFICGVRFSYRFYVEFFKNRISVARAAAEQKVMIIGGGAAGRAVIRELHESDKIDLIPCCVIDDNANKWKREIEGVPIAGGRESILLNVEKYDIDQIYFCIPTASAKVKKEILDICKESGCPMKSLPGIYQMANDEVHVSSMKPVAVEDLLGREPVRVNMDEIYQEIQGKTILVTGSGSIGSELCRQIAGHQPKQLIVLDIYENTTYALELELKENYPDLNLVALIGSVRDSRRMQQIFAIYRPDIVYHTAAHKHVPLMEYSPNEAIKNNVIGTYKTACAALKYGTKRFVLISTDKAVNPTNIMGASKRLCEMVIQSMDAVSRSGRLDLLPLLSVHEQGKMKGSPDFAPENDPREQPVCDQTAKTQEDLKIESVKDRDRNGTQFVAVRFGNVLGSNGSVIPRFKEQIAAGGPVTVTDPNITRFFMTIPEAVSLILQAGTYAWGGEIFVLDMGEPVRIDTLARNLIRLSGFKPDEDIRIVYTGLRPGEKCYEEKLMAEEGIKKTDNEMIYIGKPIPFEVEDFLRQLGTLAGASYENDEEIIKLVEQIVPTFHPVGEHPKGAKA